MNITINTDYKFLQDFIEYIPETFDLSGNTIYTGRNSIKEFEFLGIRIVVKSFKKPIIFNRYIYTVFRKSKARRSYEHGLEIIKRGLETPVPVAYIEVKRFGGLSESYFISLKCEYPRLMREFCEYYPDSDNDVLVEFARMTAHMHNAGIYHKDYSAGNILFNKSEKGIQFSVVDINRVRFGTVSEEMGYKNFYRIWFIDQAFRIVGREYGMARGFDPEKSMEKVLFYKNTFMDSCK